MANQLEVSNPDFPFNYIMRTLPKKANLSKKPAPSDEINYGKYLVTAAACGDCHQITSFEGRGNANDHAMGHVFGHE